jgi:hypothetical protein
VEVDMTVVGGAVASEPSPRESVLLPTLEAFFSFSRRYGRQGIDKSPKNFSNSIVLTVVIKSSGELVLESSCALAWIEELSKCTVETDPVAPFKCFNDFLGLSLLSLLEDSCLLGGPEFFLLRVSLSMLVAFPLHSDTVEASDLFPLRSSLDFLSLIGEKNRGQGLKSSWRK